MGRKRVFGNGLESCLCNDEVGRVGAEAERERGIKFVAENALTGSSTWSLRIVLCSVNKFIVQVT